MNDFVPAEPIHPGEFVRDELEERGLTQTDLADITGLSRRLINGILAGTASITPAVALVLAEVFDTSAETWLNLQSLHDLAAARTAADDDTPRRVAVQEKVPVRDVARRAAIYTKVPVRDVARRGWIDFGKDIGTDELESSVCSFLGTASIVDPLPFAVAARKSTDYATENPAQVAWYARVLQLARVAPVTATYSPGLLPSCEEGLRALMQNAEDVRRVPRVLANSGIRLVLLEHLPKTKIDGVMIWLDENSPVIALSLRMDRVDNFWFTLLHELSHVRHHDEGTVNTVDTDITAVDAEGLNEVELRANAEAADGLVPTKNIQSFIARKKPYFYRKDVLGFAGRMGVHPGIVVGQLQHRGAIKYTQLRKELAKVREFLIGEAVTDGWGNTPSV